MIKCDYAFSASSIRRKVRSFSRFFRQVLPVVRRRTRGIIVFTRLKSSTRCQWVNSLRLTNNIKLQTIRNVHETDRAFLEYPEDSLKIGEEKVEKPKIH